jgi:DNA-binding PadR family transcriptional regulator
MPRSSDELTAGEWAVLALLVEEPTHGFAIARAMAPEGEVGRIWSVRRPLVYRAIETLTGMGLVRPAGTVPSRS